MTLNLSNEVKHSIVISPLTKKKGPDRPELRKGDSR